MSEVDDRDKLIDERDATIERLTRELKEQKEYGGIHTCHDHCTRIECVQRRRISALERALEKSHAALSIGMSNMRAGGFAQDHPAVATMSDAFGAANEAIRNGGG